MAGQSRKARLGHAARHLTLALFAVLALAAAPAAARADTLLQWEPSATLFWVVNGNAIVNLFQNGECTQWAEQRRPDVLQRMIVGIVAGELARGNVEAMPSFDARYWTAEANSVGIRTGHAPRAGALIVFQPGTLGAGSTGHIAYVVRVNRKSFVISEMHAPLLYHVTRRALPKSAARLRGVSFIY